MPAAVLCYHSNNVTGPDYSTNDHVALAADLRLLQQLGIRVVSLEKIVSGVTAGGLEEPCVGISFDDGSWFDWYDLEHPTLGCQRSFANILADAERESRMRLHATSFVIVSPRSNRSCAAIDCECRKCRSLQCDPPAVGKSPWKVAGDTAIELTGFGVR